MSRGVFLLPALALLATGCGGPEGPPTGTVAGTVTIAGAAPAEPMRIEFFNSLTGRGSGALVGEEGAYELEQPVPVGDYKVFFTPPPPVMTGNTPPPPFQPLKAVPPAFTTDSASPMTKSVAEGSNTIDVEIPKP